MPQPITTIRETRKMGKGLHGKAVGEASGGPGTEAKTAVLRAPSVQAGLHPCGPFGRGGQDALRLTSGLLSALSPHLAGVFFTALCVPAEAHAGAGQVFAAAVSSVVRGGLGGLGAIAWPVAALLLIGKVQGRVQGAGQEGVSFTGLRRARNTGLGPASRRLPRASEARLLRPLRASSLKQILRPEPSSPLLASPSLRLPAGPRPYLLLHLGMAKGARGQVIR